MYSPIWTSRQERRISNWKHVHIWSQNSFSCSFIYKVQVRCMPILLSVFWSSSKDALFFSVFSFYHKLRKLSYWSFLKFNLRSESQSDANCFVDIWIIQVKYLHFQFLNCRLHMDSSIKSCDWNRGISVSGILWCLTEKCRFLR